jgi:hypothetical protein
VLLFPVLGNGIQKLCHLKCAVRYGLHGAFAVKRADMSRIEVSQIDSDHPSEETPERRTSAGVPCLQMCFLPRLQEACKGKVISALVVDSTCGPQNPQPQCQPSAHSLALPHDQHVTKSQTPACSAGPAQLGCPQYDAEAMVPSAWSKGLFQHPAAILLIGLLLPQSYCCCLCDA